MPHHPNEENTGENLTDKVAATSKDSTASTHELHDENKGPLEQTSDDSSATAQAHKSKGPQITENMPNVEGTKDELKAKAQELNK